METKKEIEKMIDELCQLDQAIQDGRKIEKTSLCKVSALSKGGFSMHTNPVIMIARC